MVQSNPTASAISWGAVFAGAVVAAVLSLILLLLGTGLGLSSISPWSSRGIDASAFGISAIVWISVTQLIAAGLGGYLTGRLRVKWADAHVDEVYFRDTAHGFLAWSVATLTTAVLLTATIGAVVNSGVQAASHLVSGVAQAGAMTTASLHEGNQEAGAGNSDVSAYFVDALFRPKEGAAPASGENTQAVPLDEVSRILTHALTTNTLPQDDIAYLGQLVSSRTGLTQQEAEKRVEDLYAKLQSTLKTAAAKAKEVADAARKASVYITLWLFVSLLIGAFSASLAATWGGRSRDA